MFAAIAFPISSYQTFTYQIPADLDDRIKVGMRVRVPLGRRNAQGIVVGLTEKVAFGGKIRAITELVDDQPVLDQKLWSLMEWMSGYYFTPMGQVARAVLPKDLSAGYTPPTRWSVRKLDSEPDWSAFGNAPVQERILRQVLQDDGWQPMADFNALASSPLSVCRALAEKGLVELQEIVCQPDATGFTFKPVQKKISFSEAQKTALHEINQTIVTPGFSPFILHGVTGSGKTEIYVAAARQALDLGMSVIVLLPEISITPQIGGRFRSVFGETVGLWHSGMNPALRAWTWKKICSGDYRVIVGARSAVFSPLKNLGLIVVDEEQENSYKQDSPAPRYHARDVALMRGKIHGAAVVLASATPSLESYYNQIQKKLKYIHLPDRYGGAVYPQVHIVDMKKEQEESGKIGQVFSGLLLEKIEDRLKKNEQSIILKNRRGYAPVMRCGSCGETIMCRQCQVALAYHKTTRNFQCHFCGYKTSVLPEGCPACHGPNLNLAGVGTQRIEEILEETFPSARILRLDQDTNTSTTRLTRILETFSSGNGDILIGTQMIAKGLDFNRVTLAGIVNADSGLMIPDFRSGERIFQLIYQTAGRTGRYQLPGEAIIQTYNPEDPVIRHAGQLQVLTYYNVVLAERQELNYPPFSWMVKMEISGASKSHVETRAAAIKNQLKKHPRQIEILGPAFCYREKLRNRYRMQIILKSSKSSDPNGTGLRKWLWTNLQENQTLKTVRGVSVHIDVDPVSLA